MKMQSIMALVLCATALPTLANAQTVVGTTTGGPTWNRPITGAPPTPPLSGIGTAVPYTVIPLTINTNGSYVFQSTAITPGYDNYAFLYQNSFNPAAQFTNLLVGSDDNPTVGLSGFTIALTTGTNYFFVGSGFDNLDFGDFSLNVSGPGIATFDRISAAVPEPTTWAMLLLGFGGIGYSMRRSRWKTATAKFA